LSLTIIIISTTTTTPTAYAAAIAAITAIAATTTTPTASAAAIAAITAIAAATTTTATTTTTILISINYKRIYVHMKRSFAAPASRFAGFFCLGIAGWNETLSRLTHLKRGFETRQKELNSSLQ
jgi:hypothetical protein